MGELKTPTANSAQSSINKKKNIKIKNSFLFFDFIFRTRYSNPKPKDDSIRKANIKSKTDQLNAAFPFNCSTKGMISNRTMHKRIIFCTLLNLTSNCIFKITFKFIVDFYIRNSTTKTHINCLMYI